MKRAEAKGKRGQRQAAAQAQAPPPTSDYAQDESRQPAQKTKPKRLAPNFMPWVQAKPSDAESSSPDAESLEADNESLTPAPQRRPRLKPSLPWLKPSNGSNRHEAESEADSETSPVYAAERVPSRKTSPLSNLPWLSKLTAGDDEDEGESAAQANGVPQQQQQQRRRQERREKERPSIQRLIPWLRPSATTG